MNKVFIVGRLTRQPEARTTQNGVSVTRFTVAVTRRTNREEADFLNVITWRGLADICAKYLVQGQQVAVVGEIRTRSYDANDGTKRYVTEIQADDVEFLSRPNGSSQGNYQNYSPEAGRTNNNRQTQTNEDDLFESEMGDVLIEDNDLPF